VRRIEASGGLELGPRGGPWIDVVPLPPAHSITMEGVVKAVKEGLEWYSWRELAAEMPIRHPGMKGVMGTGKTLSIRFLHPHKH